MEFSLALTPYRQFPDHRHLLATVGAAERLGFWSVNLGDHVAIGDASDGARNVQPLYYDPLVLGSAILSRYSILRVVFNVLVLPYWHPVRLAKQLAVLDVLSEGRLSVGVGVGWLRSEFEAMGAPFDERGAITDEYIGAMQALWRDHPASFEGRYVSFKNIVSEPRPYQKEQPDLWIGVGPSSVGIGRAVRVGADGMSFMARPPELLQRHIELAREQVEKSGRDVDAFGFAYSLDYGQENPIMLPHYRTAGRAAHEVLSAVPERAMEQIDGYRRLGFTHLFLWFSAEGHSEFEERMAQFSEEIMSPLRGGGS